MPAFPLRSQDVPGAGDLGGGLLGREPVGLHRPVRQGVAGLPFGLQLRDAPHRVSPRQHGPDHRAGGPVPLDRQALQYRIRARLEAHDDSTPGHEGAIGLGHRDASSSRNDLPASSAEPGKDIRLVLSEGGLALLLEYFGNRPPGRGFYLVVHVDVAPAQQVRSYATDGGLAGAREARQEDVGPGHGSPPSARSPASYIRSTGASCNVHISKAAAPWYTSIHRPPSTFAPALCASSISGVC